MRRLVTLGAAVMIVAGCASQQPVTPARTSTTTSPSLPATAAPYTAPAQPPQKPGPLDIQPSQDAHDRLSKVLTGTLVDSGGFHGSRYNPDDPVEQDGHQIAFTTPSNKIICAGGTTNLICAAAADKRPEPPKPIDKPLGNWEPYIEFDSGKLTYGVAAGNPMTPAAATVLPYGSTLRFGDIECLSARDGITCVDFPSSTGFHLSRDDLTPMKAAEPLTPDNRVEPRTPGNQFCGALVTRPALDDAIKSLPNRGGLSWEPMGTGDYYTCHDLQLFQAGTDGETGKNLPEVPTYLLAFDRGRFVGSVTDRAYPWLTGEVDKDDPTLIHLTLDVVRNGKSSRATVRARYADGHITLLDPIPDGAIPAT